MESKVDPEVAKIMIEAGAQKVDEEPVKKSKPLKPARSQAELTRVRQGYLLISLNCLNVCIGALIALRAFGLI